MPEKASISGMDTKGKKLPQKQFRIVGHAAFIPHQGNIIFASRPDLLNPNAWC
jgi:hypothetical protein